MTFRSHISIFYKLGIVVIAFLQLCTAICQSGFNQTFETGASISFRSILYTNNNLVISGIYRTETNSYQHGFIATIDTLGEIVWWRDIKDDSSSITINAESGMCISKNDLIAVKYGHFEKNSIGIALIDFSGVVLQISEFEQTGTLNTIPRDIIPVMDGFIISGSMQFPDFNVDAFVIKIDSIGQILWMKTYGHPVYWESARTITRAEENEFVISGTRYQWDQDPVFDHGWAFAIDSLGNMKWEWEAPENEIPHRGIMSMAYDSSNNEWVYISFIEKAFFIQDLNREVNLSMPVLVRRDASMQLISFFGYGPYSYNGYMGVLNESHDGGYVAAGGFTCVTEQSPYNDCNIETGRVIKMSADGAFEWSVIDTAFWHPELGSRSYLSGVTESPSGSVYAAGWANNYDENEIYRSFGWLLKITADGCVDTVCTTTSLLDQFSITNKDIVVYPNPTTNYLIFRTDEAILDAYVELFDLNGHLLQHQKMTSGTHAMIFDKAYASGMYLWRVMLSDGRLLDSGKFVVKE